jgi:hypothetical protein
LKRERLINLAQIQSGYQARSKVLESPQGTHRLLQARDIQDGALQWATALRFNPDLDPERYRLQADNILFIARGFENKAYRVIDPPPNLLASNLFYIIRVKSDLVHPGFLAWWLNQKPAQAYFAQFQVKMGFAYLSKKNLSNLKVPLPPRETQENIAEVQRLWEREKSLSNEIADLKKKIITSTCLSTIHRNEG